jgi:fermentation-respiration switch protein FrsA (DUF1100 family)
LHAKYLIVLALAIAGAIPYGCHAAWSTALGGGIQVLNLSVLERSVRAVLSAGGGASSLAPSTGLTLVGQLALFLRTLLFFTAVVYVLAVVPVQPIAFLVGLLTVVPAVIWHGLAPTASRS